MVENEKNNLPLYKEGNIAVWGDVKTMRNPDTLEEYEMMMYNIQEKNGDEITYTSAKGDVGGTRLTAEEIALVYMGESLTLELTSKATSTPYDVFLVNAGKCSHPVTKSDGRHYENNRMDIGFVYPVRKRESNELTAYVVPTRGAQRDEVKVFRRSGPPNNPVFLNPQDAFDLVAGREFIKEGLLLKMGEVVESEYNGKPQLTARVDWTIARLQQQSASERKTSRQSL